jgi:hypothetical protein
VGRPLLVSARLNLARRRLIATVVGVDLPLADQTPIAECKLDLEGLRAQRERYRKLSAALEGTERAAGVLTARFSPALDEELLNRTLAIERECCEFFRIDYDAADRVLTVRVDDTQLDPALDGLRHALTA